jgi:hypothetical protein
MIMKKISENSSFCIKPAWQKNMGEFTVLHAWLPE